MKDLTKEPLEEILKECSILEGIPHMQHRVLRHFNYFVNDPDQEVKEKYHKKAKIQSNKPNALKKWALLYYRYCYDEYGN
jgi:hypothetical protein